MWNILRQKRAIIENKIVADSQSVNQGEVVDFNSSGEIIQSLTANAPSWENLINQTVAQTTTGYQTGFCWLSEDLIGVIFQPSTSSTQTYAYTYSFSQKKILGFKSCTAYKTPQSSILYCCKVSDYVFAGVQMSKNNSNTMVFWATIRKNTGEMVALSSTGDSESTLFDCLACCQVEDGVFLSVNSDSTKTVTIYKNTVSLASMQVEFQSMGTYTHSSLNTSGLSFMKKINDSTIVGIVQWGTPNGGSVQYQLFSVDLSSFSITWGTPQGNVIMKNGSELVLSDQSRAGYYFLDLTESYCVVHWRDANSSDSVCQEGIAKIPYNNLILTPTETAYITGFNYRVHDTNLFYDKVDKCYIGTVQQRYITYWDEDTWEVKYQLMDGFDYKASVAGSVIVSVNGTNYLFDNKGYLLKFLQKGGQIGSSFNNSSNTAIALQDGASGETIPVILEGTIKQDWVTTDTSIRTTGINAQGVSDKWLNVMPKWQYQLLKG